MRVLTITLMLVLLSGCQALRQAPAADVINAVSCADLDCWLSEADRSLMLTEEQAQAELQETVKDNNGKPNRLFLYALLNQQLKDRLGWIRARDSLQQLSASSELSASLLRLVRLLQFHNQSMINADARQTRLLEALQQDDHKQQALVAELQLSQQQVVELSQKIEALTNLEESMSIRRALTTDTPKGSADD